MKKVKLNVSERLYAIRLLNAFKGDHETLAFILEDIKNIAIDEKDWKKADRKINVEQGEDGKPITSWVWDDIKGGDKEIDLNDKVVEYIINDIETKNKAGEFTLQDKAVISLNKKLKEAK